MHLINILRKFIFKTMIFIGWFTPTESFAQDYDLLLLNAVWDNDTAIVKLALTNKANVNTQNSDGTPVLHIACYNNQLPLVRMLTEAGADLNRADRSGNTPLHICAFNGKDSIAEYLFLKGADIERKDLNGYTPLLLSVYQGYYVFADMMLYYGANPNAKANDSTGLIHLAVLLADTGLLQLAIKHVSSVNTCNAKGYTPLTLAIINHDTLMMHSLLDAGAKPNDACGYSWAPDAFSVASRENNTKAMQILLKDSSIDKQYLLKVHDNVLRSGHPTMRKLFAKAEVPMSWKPVFQGLSIQCNINTSFQDFFLGAGLETVEMKSGIGIGAGFGTRVWKNSIIRQMSPGVFFQLRENRAFASFEIFKSFGLFAAGASHFRMQVGWQRLYSAGRYEAYQLDPWKGWISAPSITFLFVKSKMNYRLGFRLYDFHIGESKFFIHSGVALVIPYLN